MSRRRGVGDLIDELNRDLASELGAIIRCNYQASKAVGPQCENLRALLRSEVRDGLEHAAFLSETIVELGGEPTTLPADFDKPWSLRFMVEVDVALEQARLRRYEAHARLAGELGRPDLQARLESFASAESDRVRQLERTLESL